MRVTRTHIGAAALIVAAALYPLTASGLATDDDIPGVVLPPSGFSETLDATNSEPGARDFSDVYRIELAKGQWFHASMAGAPGTDFDLYLFGPEATSAGGRTSAVAHSEGQDTSGERILYRAAAAGTYYLEAHAFQGAGSYRIKHGVPAETPVLTASAPTTVKWGASAPVTGALQASSGAVAGARLHVFAREAGSLSWRRVARVRTDSAGNYSVSLSPKKKTAYEVRYLGSSTYLPAKADTVRVTPRAYLTRPSAPKTVRARESFETGGFLKPRHTPGSKSVRVLCYRKELGEDGTSRYVLRRTFSAVNKDYRTYTKYQARITLPERGVWKLVAKIDGDTLHATTVSGGRYRMAY